jgi:GT2 family glycosyltransferase
MPELLKKCLASLDSKLDPELILVLDKNTKYDSFETNIKNVRKVWIDFKTKSWAAGMNVAFERVNKDYMISVQDDCLCEPDTLDRLYEIYKENDYALLSPNIKERDGNISDGDDIIEVVRENPIMGRLFSFFMLSKKIYLEIGRFDEQFYPIYYDDADYMWRLRLAGYRIGLVRYLQVKHEGRGTVKCIDTTESEKKYRLKWGGGAYREEVYTTPYGD